MQFLIRLYLAPPWTLARSLPIPDAHQSQRHYGYPLLSLYLTQEQGFTLEEAG